MKLNVEELAREAGFEQVMRHKNGNSTVLPTPMFERLTRLIVERCAVECDKEKREFLEQSEKNDGRQSDMAFGSVNSAERIAAAIRNLLED